MTLKQIEESMVSAKSVGAALKPLPVSTANSD